MSTNLVFLLGNVGIVRFKELASGPMLSFSLATSEKAGEKQYTQWHDVVCFGNQALAFKDRIEKGLQVFIEGKITYYQKEKDGSKQKFTNIKPIQIIIVKAGEKEKPTDLIDDRVGIDEDEQLPF